MTRESGAAARRRTWPLLLLPVQAALMVGLGTLLTGLATDRRRLAWEDRASRHLAEERAAPLTAVTRWLSVLADTETVIGVTAVCVVALLVLPRVPWCAEALFLTASVAVQSAVFLLVTALVRRPRPDVPRLDGAPPTSSFPSGHVGASVALYAGLAVIVLLRTRGRGRWRYAVAAAALLVPAAVALSRLYRGMHYPTDVVGGLLNGAATLLIIGAVALSGRAPGPRPEPRSVAAPGTNAGAASGAARSGRARTAARALAARYSCSDATFGARLLVTAAVTAAASVPFALALILVESQWPPLHRLDRAVAEHLHEAALARPGWVSVLRVFSDYVWDPVTLRLLVAALVLWLLSRRAWRLAAWASVTAVAGALTGATVKIVVERARPSLPDPVAHAPGFAFPSGHAMTGVTSCAVLLLVLLPLVPRAWRPVPWALALVSALGVGYTRVALGVHWVSDVVGGWLLGLAVVAATTLVFEAWRADSGRRRTTVAEEGLEPELAGPDPEAPVDVRTHGPAGGQP